MTPEERAAKVTQGWKGLILHAQSLINYQKCDEVYVVTGGVEAAQQLIADAIRDAVAAERKQWLAALEEQSAADLCSGDGPLFDLKNTIREGE